MSNFSKPENALKRAEEFINVGQKTSALQVLHDVISSRRFKAWSQILEQIMLKCLTLCVELRKGKWAKDCLHQFRVVCQQTNLNSLETVIKHFLEKSEEGAKDAQSKADKVLLDIEDLDEEETPESQMMTSVGGEDQKQEQIGKSLPLG